MDESFTARNFGESFEGLDIKSDYSEEPEPYEEIEVVSSRPSSIRGGMFSDFVNKNADAWTTKSSIHDSN